MMSETGDVSLESGPQIEGVENEMGPAAIQSIASKEIMLDIKSKKGQ